MLFDLDNTLTDRQPSVARYAERFAVDFAAHLDPGGIPLVPEVMAWADGGGYRTREENFRGVWEGLPWRKPVSLGAIENHWRSLFPSCSLPMPGVYEMLESLRERGLKMGIVTNGSTAGQNAKIDCLGIRKYLDCVMISEEAGVSKPDERIFARALDGLSVEPESAWFVGDHPVNDVIGSQQAGLTGVWLRGFHSWPTYHPEPQWALDGLDELIPSIEQGDR